MENQANSKNIILNYGLLLGVLTILISLIVYASGNHLQPHWSVSLFSILFMIAAIVYGIKKFKESNNDFLSWGQAVKIGVGISIIAALLSVIYNIIFVTYIEPDYMTQLMEIQTQGMLEQGMTDEEIEMAVSMTEKFSSPYLSAAFGIIGSAIGGFIISAIAGAIMKRTEENQY